MNTKQFTDSPINLVQRLACFDPARHGGEFMASQMMGVEYLNRIIPLSLNPSPPMGEGSETFSHREKAGVHGKEKSG